MSIVSKAALINAQVSINRAVWMANRNGESPPKPIDWEYVERESHMAIIDLQLVVGNITAQEHRARLKEIHKKYPLNVVEE